jgi:N-dimethylarginine dimethylaminohydrolase
MVYRTTATLDFERDDRPALSLPRDVVLTTPTHFDVTYVINPHMANRVGTVNPAVAHQQWKALRAAYTALDIRVHTVEGQPGLPDMVFCANQTLPYLDPDSGERGVLLSRMHADERKPEVPHYARFFAATGHTVRSLPEDVTTDFEGMGDAIWHPGRHLLWGGFGIRTGLAAYEAIGTLLDVPVLALQLDDPDFYHLDTCFSALDATSVLIYPDAFDADGRALLDRFFDTVVDAPEDEARHQFACNAHCPDGTHVLIQEGCTTTNRRLREAGFVPVPLDTSEFLKAGGSVFCMKLMTWGASAGGSGRVSTTPD